MNEEHSSIPSRDPQEVNHVTRPPSNAFSLRYDDEQGLHAQITPGALNRLAAICGHIWAKGWPFVVGFVSGVMTV